MYFPPYSNKLKKSTADEPSCIVDTQMNNTHLSHDNTIIGMPRTDKVFDESGNSLPALEYSDMMDYSILPTDLFLIPNYFLCSIT